MKHEENKPSLEQRVKELEDGRVGCLGEILFYVAVGVVTVIFLWKFDTIDDRLKQCEAAHPAQAVEQVGR